MTQPSISAFLPLLAKDIDRADILLRSLRYFPQPLRSLSIACRDGDLAPAEALARRHPELKIVVATEASILGPRLAALKGLAPRWARDRQQMLLKLWAAASSESPLLLTLDADVVLTRRLRVADVGLVGKPPLVAFAPVQHPAWYEASARLLRLPVPMQEMGVTPAILRRDVTRQLLESLDLMLPSSAGARLNLTRRTWTEYALYYTWLAGTGQSQDYHRTVRYADWFGPSVWYAEDWPAWRFPTPKSPVDAPFCVIQSSAQVPCEAIVERIRQELPDF